MEMNILVLGYERIDITMTVTYCYSKRKKIQSFDNLVWIISFTLK